ncbi:MAG: PEP-CTERM sorting domain-containing protein, partial [Planctomycetota bacterium]
PFGLEIDSPVEISFSARIEDGTLTDDGDFITGFAASGNGTIEGGLVPEPASILVAALAAAFTAAAAMRRRLG